jgi:hypothetical protein
MPLRIFAQLRKQLAIQAWRRKARKKSTARLMITDVPGFLQKLEQRGIRSVVLRWPDEVPQSASAEKVCTEDVDLLIDGNGLDCAIEIAAGQPGKIKCDLYTSTGHRGTTYRKMPYYPPVLADRILSHRECYNSSFHIPDPLTHFCSLAFHLVYHKGLESGIPSGCHLETSPAPKRDYGKLLEGLACAAGIPLEAPTSLFQLHQLLKKHDWEMPPDLLVRWPKQTDWHRWLLKQETNLLCPWAEKLPNLLVFILREDATGHGLTSQICEMLSEKFSILAVEEFSEQQQNSVMRKVRGGNWTEHRKTTLVRPTVAVICYDHHPAKVAEGAAGKKAKSSYPLVENQNIFLKHEIRERINQLQKIQPAIHGIHGSDNAYESQHMIQAVFGPESDRMNQQFLNEVCETTELQKAS